jgi:hypothetical protein
LLELHNASSDPRGVVVLASVLVAPTVVAAASAIERRRGASAAGWVMALPVSLAVAVTGVSLDLGDRAAAVLALSAAAQIVAQIAFAVGFAAALRERGLVAGLIAGATGYAVCCAVIARVPSAIAVIAAVPVLSIAPRLIRTNRLETAAATVRRRRDTALACLVAMLIVGVVMLTSRATGPAVAGAIGAFPSMSATLALSLGRSRGRPAAAQALHGLVRSLPCYLAFCLVIAVAAPAVAVLPAMAIAVAACLTVGRLTWRTVQVAPAG